jgi:DedD protein
MPAESMTDQQFHEIQLSGKQLVFVFMSAVVVAVVIFLLGVSVGRGVRGLQQAGAVADAGATSDTVVPAAPPAASPKPGDLSYHDVLTGKDKSGPAPAGSSAPPSSAAAAPATTPPAAAPPATTTPAPPPAAVATGAGASGAKASPPATDTKQTNAKSSDTKARPETKSATETKPPVPAGWYLQFGGYNSKENADAHVQQLKAKGYAAFVHSTTGAGPRYKVRMGPYAEKAEADQQAARLLAAGQKPLVTR